MLSSWRNLRSLNNFILFISSKQESLVRESKIVAIKIQGNEAWNSWVSIKRGNYICLICRLCIERSGRESFAATQGVHAEKMRAILSCFVIPLHSPSVVLVFADRGSISRCRVITWFDQNKCGPFPHPLHLLIIIILLNFPLFCPSPLVFLCCLSPNRWRWGSMKAASFTQPFVRLSPEQIKLTFYKIKISCI